MKRTPTTHACTMPARNGGPGFPAGDETVFDQVAQQATELFRAPVALIVLRDSSGDHVAARAGRLSPAETRQGPQLCARIMDGNRAIAIAGGTGETMPMRYRRMLERHRIRFVAGYPIRNADGAALGALVLMDRRARLFFSEGDLNALGELARSVEDHIDHLAPDSRGLSTPSTGARPALRLVRDSRDSGLETHDDDICVLAIDIDIPAEIECALGSGAMDNINRRIRNRLGLIMRDSDAIDHTPQGEFILCIRGGEKAARQVARRVGAMLDGSRLGLCPPG